MKKTLLVLFLAVFCCAATVFAQTVTVKGKVIAADDGYPLPGVTVKVKNTKQVTSTDLNGTYTIGVAVGQTLVFSYIGTIPQEKVVGSSGTINIQLAQDVRSLKEVTVTTGFGVKQSSRDLTSPVQTIKGADIQQTQRENFLDALQGRLAGVSVTSTSGNPGASSSVVVRGYNSVGGGNSPLFVIDGVRVSNDAVDQASLTSNGANRSADFTDRIADINPDDIETLTVLKGADAAAVYGSSAASGAIIITTKKGHSGAGSVSYDNDFGYATTYRFPDIQNVYGSGTNGNPNPVYRTAFGPAYAPGTVTYNNPKNVTQTGRTTINNFAFEGGNDVSTYRLSTSIRSTTGVLPVEYNDKVSVRLTGTSKVSSTLTSSASFNYFNTDNRKLNKGNTGTYLESLIWPTYDDVRNYANPDGSKRTLLPPTTSLADGSIDFDNPLWDANNNISDDKTNRIVGNFDLSFDPLKWLNIRALAGVDYATTTGNNFISQYSSAYQNSALNSFAATTGISAGGIIDNYNDNNLQVNGSLFATAKNSFGDFRTTLAVGVEAINNSNDVIGVYGQSFIEPDFNSINNTLPTTQRSSDNLQRSRYLSQIARLNIAYKDMIVLNATGRQEYSSKLYGSIQDHYFYPSVGAGFIFTELPVLKDNPILSYGKLRIAYAEVGKDLPAPYKIQSTLIQQATTGGGFAYDVTGNNAKLTPERDKEFDLGGELQFLKGRIGLDVSYYTVKASKQIFPTRISYATGFVIEYINGAETENHGVEISLNAIPVQTKKFTWSTVVNFTSAHGTVTSLGSFPEYYNSDTWLYSNVRSSVFPGSSTGNIAAYSYARNNAGQILVDPASGLPVSNATFITVGDRTPKFMVGWTNNISFANFDLSFLFDIRKGGDVYDGTEEFLTRYGLSTSTLDRYTPRIVPGVLNDGKQNSANPTVNTISIIPAYQNTFYTSSIDGDFVQHDVNWVRLKDVTLSYKIPQSILSRQKLFKYASVFATATDVFMLTNYKGADPNVNGTNSSTQGIGAGGFDFGTLPTPRVISFGLKVRL